MTILFLTSDLVFSSRVSGAASRLSHELSTAMTVAKLLDQLATTADVALVIVDLNTSGIDVRNVVASARALAKQPIAVVAYGPHVHEDRLAEAQEAGCDEVLSRGQFNAQMDAVLSRWAKIKPG